MQLAPNSIVFHLYSPYYFAVSGLMPDKRSYLHLQILGGKSFLDKEEPSCRKTEQSQSTVTLHVHLHGQRCKSQPVPSAYDLALKEGTVWSWYDRRYLRNIKRAPCLHSLMQTREGVWENEKVCVNPSRRGEDLHKLSSSPKLTRVFASGYVNTTSVLYLFYKINVLQK